MDGPQQDSTAAGPVMGMAQASQQTTPGVSSNTPADYDHPLRPIVAQWMEKIRLALKYKKALFGDDADECMAFFNGPYDFMYNKKYTGNSGGFQVGDKEDDIPPPAFRMTVNKATEVVQLFGPILYHRNPNRQVNPRELPQLPAEIFGNMADPNSQMMMQQAGMANAQMKTADYARAALLQFYLNYTPVELDLKTHSRRAIDEALIKGMGCLWTEVYQPKGAQFKLVGSFYDTVDNLVIDPDVECLDDAQWVARKCTHPVWQVEQEYGLEPGSLKGNMESVNRQSEVNVNPDGDFDRKKGTTNDLMVYWKIWSKMGVGERLQGAPQELKQVLQQFGDYCFLVVAEHTPYPLNLPPAAINNADPNAAEQVLQKLDWPIPFWLDDAWPFTPIQFHEVPRQSWPMSHLKPAMGELKFLNWAYSYMASKIRITSRDFLAVKKALGEEVKDIILHGNDLTLIELEHQHGSITECVQFLAHPQINGDIWKVIQAIEENFEKRTGLSELMYGQTQTQDRSAEDSANKNRAMQVRPDDMSQKIEDAMSAIARKEALAIRWFLKGQDVQEIMGPVCAHFWDQFVTESDPYAIVRQLEYRIEAGSIRKPNRDRDTQNMSQAMQSIFQPLYQYAQASGDVGPVNALISNWARTLDMDPTPYLLKPPQPPAPVPGQPPAGGHPPAGHPAPAPAAAPPRAA